MLASETADLRGERGRVRDEQLCNAIGFSPDNTEGVQMDVQPTSRTTGWFSEYRTFFGAARSNPRVVGAVVPTTPAVGATVAQVVPSTGAPVVVELGPGTGTLSDGIHRRLP